MAIVLILLSLPFLALSAHAFWASHHDLNLSNVLAAQLHLSIPAFGALSLIVGLTLLIVGLVRFQRRSP